MLYKDIAFRKVSFPSCVVCVVFFLHPPNRCCTLLFTPRLSTVSVLQKKRKHQQLRHQPLFPNKHHEWYRCRDNSHWPSGSWHLTSKATTRTSLAVFQLFPQAWSGERGQGGGWGGGNLRGRVKADAESHRKRNWSTVLIWKTGGGGGGAGYEDEVCGWGKQRRRWVVKDVLGPSSPTLNIHCHNVLQAMPEIPECLR